MTGQQSSYLHRKLDDRCTRPGCDNPPADGHLLCETHRDDHRARNARYAARTWQERRRRGLCGGCGGKLPRKRKRKRKGAGRMSLCSACVVIRNRTPLTGLDNRLDKSARIAAATRTHDDGRTRYHGASPGKRGQRPRSQLDQHDLGEAIGRLQRAQAAIAYAESPEVRQLPKAQRDEVVRAALGQVALAGRFLEDVEDRHRRVVAPSPPARG